MSLVLSDIAFSYAPTVAPVFEGVACEFFPGTITAVVGRSGCGKTTLFNIIAGLEQPTYGCVTRPLGNVGYQFQQALLIPWLNVRRNALFGLDVRGANDGHAFVDDLLTRYGLRDVASAAPRTLSGGMQQRVAFIRALVVKPSILLLDEPFVHSDFAMRRLMQNDIVALAAEQQLTVLMATHDLHEALVLAHRIILLGGTPTRIIDDVDLSGEDREASLMTFPPILERLWRSVEGAA